MAGNPSGILLYESALPPVNPLVGIQEISIDTATKALVKTDSNGNTYYLGVTATPNVVLLGKSLGAGASITSITVAGGVATVTQTAHGFSSNDFTVTAGATGAGVGDINQLHQITVTGANTYTFPTTASGTIGGTILAMFWFKGTRSINATKVKNIVRNNTGDYSITLTNTQTDQYYGVMGSFAGASTRFSWEFKGDSGGAPSTTGFELFTLDMTNNTNHDADAYFNLQLLGVI